ncbi:TPA: hypothetical protein ACG1XN_004811, partial [Escherichia coli]
EFYGVWEAEVEVKVVPFLSIAFRMVSSLRIQATSTAVVITPMPLMLLRCSAGSLKWFRMWVFIFQRFDDINVFFCFAGEPGTTCFAQ